MKKYITLTITLLVFFVSSWGILFFLPPPTLLSNTSFSTAVYDSHHQLLRLTLSEDDKYRVFTPLSAISPTLIAATLLQEDQYFWQHHGVNPVALVKAGWQSYVVRTHRMGASTITMQLARLRLGIHSKKITGKLLQIVKAIQFEMHYSKQQILEAYLNLAPYGRNIEGIGAASLIYFNQQPKDLNLSQALTLSLMPQNPNKRTPENQQHLKTIRNLLFVRWLKEHPKDSKYQAMMTLPLAMRRLEDLPFLAPHVVNHVLQSHVSQQNITTTIDSHIQTLLTRITNNYIHRKQALGVYNAAVLLLDVRDMQVKGLLGAVDFFNTSIQGQINGTAIKRSPGSTLKPFIYALAFDEGLIHPNTVLKDVPHHFGAYHPDNFDYDFMGPVKAKDALILSRNIPAIELASQLKHLSLYQLLEKAHVTHLKSESYYGLSLALGSAEVSMQELVALYAMLVNQGVWHPIHLSKEPSIDSQPLASVRLLSPEASFLVLDSLSQTPRPGSHAVGNPALPVSWKTGTSSGYRDAWSIGAFGPYVLAVWIGNFDNTANPAFVGKNIAAPLFFELVDSITREQGPLPTVTAPSKQLHLEKIAVCKASGLLPTRFCQDTEMTWFIPGKSPIKSDTVYREIAIDTRTGLRACHANEYTRFEVYEFWPSDLLSIFKQAGIQRRTPPPYTAGCSLISNTGQSPKITSPHAGLSYIIPTHAKQSTTIPFTAVVDADVMNLYWFINNNYLGQTHPQEPFLWTAKAGQYRIHVVDDHGLSNAIDIHVQMDG